LKRTNIPRRSLNVPLYRAAFIRNVHLLLYMGYVRLNSKTFSNSNEPVISGALCEAIEQVLDDPQSDDWVDDFEVHDDPPVHHQSRKGKTRRRVDIKLASRLMRPRLRFCFEAKRLGKKNDAGKYFGTEGLGRFVDGSYAGDQDVGGMLGYVQSDDCNAWSTKVAKTVDVTMHRVASGGNWTTTSVCPHLTNTFTTKHDRTENCGRITIYHTLLDFT
jgi:hypothetical protein